MKSLVSFSAIALTAFVLVSNYPTSSRANRADVTPMQLRLAYAGPTGMVVSWNTYSQLDEPRVFYGRRPWSLSYVASSNVSVTYPTSSTYNNHVKIASLRPNTQYYYLPENSNITTPYSFKTSRIAGDYTPYTIGFVADLGLIGPQGLWTHTGKGASNPLGRNDITTVQSLQQNSDDIDFLWHAGDIGYADAWLKEEIQGFLSNTTIADGYKVYESLLNQYYDEMAPLTSIKPYMVGPGNHEANCNNGKVNDKAHNIAYTVDICMPGQTNFTGLIYHFRMPSTESSGLSNFWYSFDHGMVHYIQLDTETDLGHGLIGPDEPGGSNGYENAGPFGSYRDAQIDWLKKDLASVDREKTPWLVVAGHRPWYISGFKCVECQKAFEPLFLEYSVDLVLSGHVHAYERQTPLKNFVVDPDELNNPSAPWYISNGAAGHYDGLEPFHGPLQSYSRFALDTVYGWSRLTFHNCTHLTHEFVVSANGSVVDSATLFKDRPCKEGYEDYGDYGFDWDGETQIWYL